MVSTIVSAVVAVLIPLLKMLFEAIEKKKISNQEFIDFIKSHQEMRSSAGKAATSWEVALKEAELENAKRKDQR